MTESAAIAAELRAKIMARPEAILEDRDVMRALIAANERAMGANVVDLRGVAMERLEARLDRLEDTHRSVIAAAYENLAGTNQIHRAVLALLEPPSFEAFLSCLATELTQILRVESIRLVLESAQADEGAALERFRDVLVVAEPGFVEDYMRGGRPAGGRSVVLRPVQPNLAALYGDKAEWIGSEALMRLDLGAGRMAGMLALGSEDGEQFRPSHGTDLLTFFAGVFERAMRRWLG
ncbi:DUF484 family protein [Albidovulum sediminicola]|uniref:DUF484 family protein n=1 Tax=Albidovulum sediminicola TaxID=2984331 RepID=A0ABT2Z602_9RHOB|nr:DUF484 family protein [Defluviimonas sp. WL0075]MCV2866206.1 DUF484 family protein [Defluviimonas sp. WL0075]